MQRRASCDRLGQIFSVGVRFLSRSFVGKLGTLVPVRLPRTKTLAFLVFM
jgi:hypothetical protein